MGFPAFLTLPDAVSQRTTTRGTLNTATTRSRTESFSFFDFYNIKTIKPMTKFTNKESYFPLALVTILFFMWGFAYGLLDVLNSQFQQVVNANMVQSLGLHAAYFGGYFIGPLTFGRIVFKTWGFKATFITGLCIYGVGTLVFWPSAVLTSFPAFLISNLIVGLGVSTLEVAANPFIAMCGPPEYAEVRLNLSQGVQAIGSVLSSLLAKKVLFKDVTSHASLIDVQWTYLGIALFDVFLAIAFYYFPIPEATDEDFEEVAEKRSSINSRKLCGYPIIYITLALGVFSQFCYVGGQEAASVVFQNYISSVDRG
jgi:fucose permease